MEVKFKKLRENAVLPSHAKPGDAGLDLTVCVVEQSIDETQETHYYGVAVEIPPGYVGLMFPRSSIKDFDVRTSNAVGVIDSGYRGELTMVFDNLGDGSRNYRAGDRTAQLVLVPYLTVETLFVDDLSETERGTGGYGSTNRTAPDAVEVLIDYKKVFKWRGKPFTHIMYTGFEVEFGKIIEVKRISFDERIYTEHGVFKLSVSVAPCDKNGVIVSGYCPK